MNTLKQVRAVLGVLAVGGSLIAALRFNATTIDPEPLELRIHVFDDVMHAVDGEVVAVERNGVTIAHHTGEGGITPVFDFLQGQTVTVSLDETNTAHGLCLGQTHTLDLPIGVYPNATELAYTRTFFQPVLTPVAITNAAMAHSKPYHTRWMTFPANGDLSTLRFQAKVGMLLSPMEIGAFERYYDVEFTPASLDFELGVVIQCARTNLGTGNLMMAIDCRGHGFTAQPSAATFLVKSSVDPELLPPTLAAVPSYWEPTTETVLLDLSGVLERGFNVVLLTQEPFDDDATRLPGNPTHHTAIDEESSGTDCEPSPPSPPANWSCVPSVPTSCPGTITNAGHNCRTVTNPAGARICGQPGESRTKEITIEWEGSVSVDVSLPGGATATASGGVSHSETESWTVNFQAGANGCGQCFRPFVHTLICATVWSKKVDKWLRLEHIHRFPCAEDVQVTTTCTDSSSSSGSCSRTCD